MKGKIIDLNSIEAFISLEDGSAIELPLSRLPLNHNTIGDIIEVQPDFYSAFNNTTLTHDTIRNSNSFDLF